MKTFKIRSCAPYSAMVETLQVEVETDDKKSVLVDRIVSSAPRSEHGDPVLLPIDQFSGKSFMLNPCGFPMNDIMAFESVQSDQLARSVLQLAGTIEAKTSSSDIS